MLALLPALGESYAVYDDGLRSYAVSLVPVEQAQVQGMSEPWSWSFGELARLLHGHGFFAMRAQEHDKGYGEGSSYWVDSEFSGVNDASGMPLVKAQRSWWWISLQVTYTRMRQKRSSTETCVGFVMMQETIDKMGSAPVFRNHNDKEYLQANSTIRVLPKPNFPWSHLVDG